MARSVNRVTLLGNLGKDAETKFTPSGTSMSTFSIATSRRSKDQQTGEWKDETDWHRCVAWKTENISNYLLKGKQVYLEGRLQTRSWEDKDGQKRFSTEVVCDANDMILLGGGRAEQGGGGQDFDRPVSMPRSAPRPQAATPQDDATFSQGVTDDDVPF